MKIAFVVQDLHRRGGTERAMVELGAALAARGHRITWFAGSKDTTVLTEAAWHHVPMIRWPSLPRYLSFLVGNTLVRLAARYWGRARFDIIHSTGPDVLRPTVTTLHCCARAFADGLEEDGSTRRWQRWKVVRRWHNKLSYRAIALFERYVVRVGARQVISVSRALAAEVEWHNGPLDGRLAVIPNGVNLHEFAPPSPAARAEVRHELGMGADEVGVLFVGYNWERKGVGVLVEALAQLLARPGLPPVTLTIVGGRAQAAYESVLVERLAGRVRFLGPRTDLARLYGASDVCVLPSLQEPFGLPILEAMACGLPVVVSRCAGVAEIINDGIDGVLLDDPRDAENLATKLLGLIASEALRRRMGARARQTAEQYSWPEIAARTEAVYRELLKRQGPGRRRMTGRNVPTDPAPEGGPEAPDIHPLVAR
jgi:glycosyltransferase involved in cell wall biosynthesis